MQHGHRGRLVHPNILVVMCVCVCMCVHVCVHVCVCICVCICTCCIFSTFPGTTASPVPTAETDSKSQVMVIRIGPFV